MTSQTVVLYLATIPWFVSTIQAGEQHQLPPWLQTLQLRGIHVAEVILGRAG